MRPHYLFWIRYVNKKIKATKKNNSRLICETKENSNYRNLN